MRTLVIGAGMASVRLVEELCRRGIRGVTVIGDEPHPPYNRILLSAVLEGTHRRGALALRNESWFRHQGVDLRLGVRVTDLDPTASEAVLDDGSRLGYDRVVLATGSRATLPPIPGLVGADGRLDSRVFAFRSLDDCERLDEAVRRARRAVVVGGGLLGVQVARALAVRGVDTEIVEGADHLLRRSLDATSGAMLRRSLTRLGTRVYTGVRATRLTAEGLRLDNGVVLATDLIVVTAGGRPAVGLAMRAGIDVGRGVLVDDQLRTSEPAVYAIGDCAEHLGRRGLPLTGFVPPAWEQAEVLARHLAGDDVAYSGTRMVARLRATDLEVAVLGDPEHTEGDVVEVSNPLRGAHRKLVVRDRTVVAGALVGDLSRVGVIAKAFEHATVLGLQEPGALLLPEITSSTTVPAGADLADDAEVCACAGVDAASIRACSSIEEVRESTRATTGCGGCAEVVAALVAAGVAGVAGAPARPEPVHLVKGPA